ncbi:HAD family hydrolase [Oceanobacillus jeddahense]|uniref:HAD family phosphatase n=1 Tax=Oceanobacillus jeddahense TaxID=1462527 RepID=A0ABY5JRZ8_9BACI|nr:HAD family phosphatase [Oceanobacillus jeddahense]UUI02999.1 HAD family phosphatase [Oceanobacillus jeddahense]
MVKAIIFDMDGVLIDSEPVQLKRYDEFLRYKGVSLPRKELNKIVGASSKLTWKMLEDRFEGILTRDAFHQELTDYHNGNDMDFSTLLNEGATEILSWLNSQNYSVALASSANINKINQVINQCGLDDFFEVVLSGDMFNESKPNPEIYLTAAEKLNMAPEECLVIEDSVYGITAAKAAGMYTVAKEELRFDFDQSKADRVVIDLFEIKQVVESIK